MDRRAHRHSCRNVPVGPHRATRLTSTTKHWCEWHPWQQLSLDAALGVHRWFDLMFLCSAGLSALLLFSLSAARPSTYALRPSDSTAQCTPRQQQLVRALLHPARDAVTTRRPRCKGPHSRRTILLRPSARTRCSSRSSSGSTLSDLGSQRKLFTLASGGDDEDRPERRVAPAIV
jgi:hypothetical protein